MSNTKAETKAQAALDAVESEAQSLIDKGVRRLSEGTTLKLGSLTVHLVGDAQVQADELKNEQAYVEALAHHAEEWGAHNLGLNVATLKNLYNRLGQLIGPKEQEAPKAPAAEADAPSDK
jgi:hypothetical protein